MEASLQPHATVASTTTVRKPGVAAIDATTLRFLPDVPGASNGDVITANADDGNLVETSTTATTPWACCTSHMTLRVGCPAGPRPSQRPASVSTGQREPESLAR